MRGAIAASLSTGREAIRQKMRLNTRRRTQPSCGATSLATQTICQVVISGLGCLSLAESSDGKTLAGRQAFVQDAADGAALAGAGPGSKIDLNGCSG